MNSGVPWQVKGVRREVIDTAREAARRSGMSVAEWLDTVISESARDAGIAPLPRTRVHHRISAVSDASDDTREWRRRHSDHGERRGGWAEELDLSDVNARLDALSNQISQLAGGSQAGRRHQRHDAPVPVNPVDEAMAEIEARQRALDGEAPAPALNLPRAPTQQLPTLEHQLREINARMDSMRPCGLDNAVETLRDDLAEIGVMLKEAMPRRAIEALESEVRSLTAKIDTKRGSGADGAAMEGLERGLAEVRDALRALTPAENLAGFGETVHDLSQKIDRLSGTGQDPAALKQLEGAILALRGVVSQVASDDALVRLSDEVRALSAKVDQVTASDAFSTIERRIASIANSLQSQEAAGQPAPGLEAMVASLSDKIERLHAVPSDHAAVRHLEERMVQLVEKLDASGARLHQLEAIERGLADLLTYVEQQQAAAPEANTLKRDVQRTQDSLEAVHGTLGHVVDRLATLETSIRNSQMPRAANIPERMPETTAPATMAAPPPNPGVMPDSAAPPRAVQPAPPPSARPAPPAASAAPMTANPSPAADRQPIDPNLPPDHPLEPGVSRGRSGSPADRIAASEAALENVRPPVIPDPGGKSNFIAAARRAAQAALVEASPAKEKAAASGQPATAAGSIAGRIGGKIRKLMVGAGVVLFVLGSLHFVATRIWFSGASTTQPAAEAPGEEPAPAAATGDSTEPPRTTPDRQSVLAPFGISINPGAIATAPSAPAAADADREATGSIRSPAPQATQSGIPLPPPSPVRATGADRLPPGIGSGGLRAAAVRGDPAAEFEIATRFAEGRGVPQNLAEAAVWFERAAGKGLAPAQFRLGGLYEKGMGVRKNIDTARRLYLAAAEAGNAKAMHNLAVLYAEGGDGKPDYQTAARWFRKAADHGVVDSQYNLAVLYARGIGVETNLAEAFKWFALASREGDREAARKRDDVAARLDKQSLTAAMTAAQAWQPQPDAAVRVAVPNGGWDGVSAPSTAKRSVGPKFEQPSRR